MYIIGFSLLLVIYFLYSLASTFISSLANWSVNLKCINLSTSDFRKDMWMSHVSTSLLSLAYMTLDSNNYYVETVGDIFYLFIINSLLSSICVPTQFYLFKSILLLGGQQIILFIPPLLVGYNFCLVWFHRDPAMQFLHLSDDLIGDGLSKHLYSLLSLILVEGCVLQVFKSNLYHCVVPGFIQ